MARTPQQREADEELRQAIDKVSRLDFGSDDPGILVDHVTVCQFVRFNSDGDEESAYYLLFPNGTIADHRAVGLLNYGLHLLLHGEREDSS